MHYLNVRSAVTKEQWIQVIKIAHKDSKHGRLACEVCKSNGNKQGFKHLLECHEHFSFNWETKTMKLERLMSLCPMCHQVIHYFLAKTLGKCEATFNHFIEVSDIDHETADKYIENAWDHVQYINRPKLSLEKYGNLKLPIITRQWKLDLTYLNRNAFNNIFNTRISKRVFKQDERKNCDISRNNKLN